VVPTDRLRYMDCMSAFFLSSETTALIAEDLRRIKHFTRGKKPRYFVIDQSAAEEGGVSWSGRRRTRSRYILLPCAPHRLTRSGCEEAFGRALSIAKDDKKAYLCQFWRDTSRWGLFTRQYSQLIQQMDTTNALD
jgi:hypothetical protein